MDPTYEQRLFRPQRSPVKSPYSSPKSKKEMYHDRFIPSRINQDKWRMLFSQMADENTDKKHKSPAAEASHTNSGSRSNTDTAGSSGSETSRDFHTYQCLLSHELGLTETLDEEMRPISSRVLQNKRVKKSNMFVYRASGQNENSVSPFSLSPIGRQTQKLLKSPVKAERKIPKVPYKVLDAPDLIDDFYLNLVDWGSQNILAVGLNASMYLWNARTSQVTKLCDLQSEGDLVTSVSWSERGNVVSVGTNKGLVQVWDVAAEKRLHILSGHEARVGTMAWNADLLTSGARDRMIIQRDLRCSTATAPERRLSAHRQEVCGLKWSPDRQHLASGGNDNRLLVWNMNSTQPQQVYTDHVAAVKAIAWSPHQHGLLASGGGTTDRKIRFWNTLTSQPLQSIDTGSQVCNLAWSRHSDELVSTHGYSQNEILVWRYPSMQQIAKLTGHLFRVLYLAGSPDGETIVTGAGDETLRFWHVFSKLRPARESRSVLNLFSNLR